MQRSGLIIVMTFIGIVGMLHGQEPLDPEYRNVTFDQKLHRNVDLDDPSPVIVVLLRNGRYLEFPPSDVLTLRQLVDRLPKDALTETSRLLLIRKHEGLMFSPEGLKTEDLSRYSLARWDLIKIEEHTEKKRPAQ